MASVESSVEISSQQSPNAWAAVLRVGQSLRYLAIAVIVVLTVGIELVIAGLLQHHPFIAQGLVSPLAVGAGFGSVMLLTVTYLIGKGWAVVGSQSEALNAVMEEGSLNLARRFNPVLDFHHPEVCREILTQQASLAARLRAPISVIELNVAEMAKNPLSAEWRQFGAELTRQVKATSRQTDSMLRWTPKSFLLVMPEVNAAELAVILTRLHNDLEGWFQERFEAHAKPTLESRGITTQALGQATGQVNDILRETQNLLDEQMLRANPQVQAQRTQVRRQKSVNLTLPFNIAGVDVQGVPFSDRIVTRRVAADCIWFASSRQISEGTSLEITDRDATICESAVVAGFTTEDGHTIVEVRFPKPPANWVM